MLAAYLICLIVGGVFVGLSVASGIGKDFDGDHEHDHDGGHGAHVEHGLEKPMEGTVAEAAHAGKPRRVWMPFTSFRFWTFGSFFFGLTGLALSQLAGVGEPTAAMVGLAAGVGGGVGAAALVHHLRKPIGHVGDARRWVGETSELLLPLSPTGVSKVRVRSGEKDRELIVTLSDKDGGALPKGTKVVILDIDHDGRARVAPESTLFTRAERDAREEMES